MNVSVPGTSLAWQTAPVTLDLTCPETAMEDVGSDTTDVGASADVGSDDGASLDSTTIGGAAGCQVAGHRPAALLCIVCGGLFLGRRRRDRTCDT